MTQKKFKLTRVALTILFCIVGMYVVSGCVINTAYDELDPFFMDCTERSEMCAMLASRHGQSMVFIAHGEALGSAEGDLAFHSQAGFYNRYSNKNEIRWMNFNYDSCDPRGYIELKEGYRIEPWSPDKSRVW